MGNQPLFWLGRVKSNQGLINKIYRWSCSHVSRQSRYYECDKCETKKGCERKKGFRKQPSRKCVASFLHNCWSALKKGTTSQTQANFDWLAHVALKISLLQNDPNILDHSWKDIWPITPGSKTFGPGLVQDKSWCSCYTRGCHIIGTYL